VVIAAKATSPALVRVRIRGTLSGLFARRTEVTAESEVAVGLAISSDLLFAMRFVLVASLLAVVGWSTSRMMTAPQQNIVGAAAGTAEQRLEPTEEDSRWSHLYRERALDALMPLSAPLVSGL